jgi:hypothetical protein
MHLRFDDRSHVTGLSDLIFCLCKSDAVRHAWYPSVQMGLLYQNSLYLAARENRGPTGCHQSNVTSRVMG